ncbi:MAG: methyltransferase, FxLD system [Frankiales bacterium]|nr:methyltransferase, FxLD system [Frankiales bacterium]
MVAELTKRGVLVSPAVIRAMLAVPRHLFLAGVDHRSAYADRAVIVLRAADATPISSASQPTMVATMLEQLTIAEGHRVLEIGTGTGYNAALLALLVGDSGTVVSVEIEAHLGAKAAETLAAVAPRRIDVVIGDGNFGYPKNAPYDRIIVTAGAREIAAKWVDQLVDGGRMVLPLVDRRGLGSVVVFDKICDQLVRRGAVRCGFLLLCEHATGTD